MIKDLVQTESTYVYLFLRIVAGVIIFPYGMQKLFGWFDDLGGGVGIRGSLEQLRRRKIPVFIGWLIIIGQSLGCLMLIFGCLTRIAAAGNLIVFTGALIVHASDGWAMNWLGKKKGEGVEYFVLLISILLVLIFKGGGAVSVDIWVAKYLAKD